jgi:hypothetical protein
VTIAIGILAAKGLVVAADTQESTGDYMKGAKGKIAAFYAYDGKWADSCVIAGAGDSGYVQALTEHLGQTFQAVDPKANMSMMEMSKKDSRPSLQSEFRDCVKRFYKEHIIPFAGYPERRRPDVEMLIACQRKVVLGMFATEKTVVNYTTPFKAIGIGCTFAELHLGKLWQGMTTEEAEILAAYVVFLTKESVEACGKYTTIATIKGPEIEESTTGGGSRMLPTQIAEFVHPGKIEKWEHSFRKKWWKAEKEKVFSLIREEQTENDEPPNPSTRRKSTGRQ